MQVTTDVPDWVECVHNVFARKCHYRCTRLDQVCSVKVSLPMYQIGSNVFRTFEEGSGALKRKGFQEKRGGEGEGKGGGDFSTSEVMR